MLDQPGTAAPSDPASRLLAPNGRPARDTVSLKCPRCGAGPERRVQSSGFGMPHDVCKQCGHEFTGQSLATDIK